MDNIDAFTRAYIGAALWSTNDNADENGGEPLDQNYGPEDIAPETLAKMKKDCADFQAKYGVPHYDANLEYTGEERAGHDFWLARNGHGTGFWDRTRELKQADRALYTAASKSFREFDLYVGDDGQIHGSPL